MTAIGRELPQVGGSFRPILLNNSLDDFLRRKYAAVPRLVPPWPFSSLFRNS